MSESKETIRRLEGEVEALKHTQSKLVLDHDLLIKIEERTKSIQEKLDALENFVTKDELVTQLEVYDLRISRLEKILYTALGTVLLSVLGALLAIVLR